MAGKRQPTDVVIAKGRKNLTKTEIAERQASEVKPLEEKQIRAPKQLPQDMKAEFVAIGNLLRALGKGLFTELDYDTLSRYLMAKKHYELAYENADRALHDDDAGESDKWSRIVDRYFKQCRNCASDLGLTISSRCQLVVPQANKPVEDKNDPMLQLLSQMEA